MTSPHRFADVPPGYAKLAGLISKDRQFAIFRKFSALNARSILYLQSELTDLESQLQRIDKELLAENEECLKSWQHFSAEPRRSSLVRKIQRTLYRYNSALVSYDTILNLHSPAAPQVNAVKSWMEFALPITDPSRDYLDSRELYGDRPRLNYASGQVYPDLVSLSKPEDSWLARVLRKSFLNTILMNDWIYFKDKSEIIYFYPGSKIDNLVTGIAVFSTFILSVAGILALHVETRETVRLVLVGGFTFLLAVIMALCGAKKAEVVMGTVGYVAVLVVFISGVGPS